jgi:hypothetical protein
MLIEAAGTKRRVQLILRTVQVLHSGDASGVCRLNRSVTDAGLMRVDEVERPVDRRQRRQEAFRSGGLRSRQPSPMRRLA